MGLLVTGCSKKDDASPSGGATVGQATLDGTTYDLKTASSNDVADTSFYTIFDYTESDSVRGASVLLNNRGKGATPRLGDYAADSCLITFQRGKDLMNLSARYFGKTGEKVTLSKDGSKYKITFSNLSETDVFKHPVTTSNSKLSGYVTSD